jgi:hypothetical protein
MGNLDSGKKLIATLHSSWKMEIIMRLPEIRNLLFISGLVCLVHSLLSNTAIAADEGAPDYAVQLEAVVIEDPPTIQLEWEPPQHSSSKRYTVFRRLPGSGDWGEGTELPGFATKFVDREIITGRSYEYKVVRTSESFQAYGYILSGIRLPPVENRGRILLLVERAIANSLANEIARHVSDLVGDGWMVSRREVDRTASVEQVKAMVLAEHKADPVGLRAVSLIGRIPVPYSGEICPDGHEPEHRGAWPADVFYADLDGKWTDEKVEVKKAKDKRHHNIPGDGKYDQSELPSMVELELGRIDLSSMPGKKGWLGAALFPSEEELIKNYLEKNHRYRHGRMGLPRRAIVQDGFGSMNGEAFTAAAWRSFPAMVGRANITKVGNKGEWIPEAGKAPWLWSFICGAGSYQSIAGIGNQKWNAGYTIDLVQNDVKSVFTMVFGSWVGDWDSEDNLMRGILATPSHGLASFWSGRPHWFIHSMGLGGTLGHVVRTTQNNGRELLYHNQRNHHLNLIHIALMGDPSLRLYPMVPPTDLEVFRNMKREVTLQWKSGETADDAAGTFYLVFRSNFPTGPFIRITPKVVDGTEFRDMNVQRGSHTYMVRKMRLEKTPSGSFYNLSQGVLVTVSVD